MFFALFRRFVVTAYVLQRVVVVIIVNLLALSGLHAQMTVSTFAGDGLSGPPFTVDGTGTAARFSYPTAITSDAAGNIYVSDQTNLRKITPAAVVTTLVPTGTFARINFAMAVDAAGNIYVADRDKHSIYKVTPMGVVSLFAGGNAMSFMGGSGYVDATGSAARFYQPAGLAIDASGNILSQMPAIIAFATLLRQEW